MPKRKPTALFRTFLSDAWHLTWERKNLWVFGIFAAVISTGGVIDVVLTSLEKVQTTSNFFVDMLNSGYLAFGFMSAYIQQLMSIGSTSTAALITALVFAALLLFSVGVLSQGSLALGVKSKKRLDPHALRQSAADHFWALSLLAVLLFIVMGILLTLMSLALFYVQMHLTSASIVTYVILTTLLIAAVVIVNIIYMFAVLDVVHNDVHPLYALEQGWNLFRKQWLSSLEFGLLMFLIVSLVATALVFGIFLLMLPYAIIFTTTLLSGSYTFFLVVNILYGLGILLFSLLIGGAIVTFQYSAWYQFYKRALHKTHGKKHFSHILKFLQ